MLSYPAPRGLITRGTGMRVHVPQHMQWLRTGVPASRSAIALASGAEDGAGTPRGAQSPHPRPLEPPQGMCSISLKGLL